MVEQKRIEYRVEWLKKNGFRECFMPGCYRHNSKEVAGGTVTDVMCRMEYGQGLFTWDPMLKDAWDWKPEEKTMKLEPVPDIRRPIATINCYVFYGHGFVCKEEAEEARRLYEAYTAAQEAYQAYVDDHGFVPFPSNKKGAIANGANAT